MTRGPAGDREFSYTAFGSVAPSRTVVVLREGAVAVSDPDARITARRDVRVLAVRVGQDDASDAAYGTEAPGSAAMIALADVVRDEALIDADTVGVVGVGQAGPEAVMLAAHLGRTADRLALVAAPRPESPLERHLGEELLAQVSADTLVLVGADDPDAGTDAARWHAAHLARACVERVALRPGSLDRRLSLTDVWERVLAHVAPA